MFEVNGRWYSNEKQYRQSEQNKRQNSAINELHRMSKRQIRDQLFKIETKRYLPNGISVNEYNKIKEMRTKKKE